MGGWRAGTWPARRSVGRDEKRGRDGPGNERGLPPPLSPAEGKYLSSVQQAASGNGAYCVEEASLLPSAPLPRPMLMREMDDRYFAE